MYLNTDFIFKLMSCSLLTLSAMSSCDCWTATIFRRTFFQHQGSTTGGGGACYIANIFFSISCFATTFYALEYGEKMTFEYQWPPTKARYKARNLVVHFVTGSWAITHFGCKIYAALACQ